MNKNKDPVGPLCGRCQRRGHTKNFCRHAPTCGICADDHWTKDCKQPKTTVPCCANCGENHTANWKGCIDYQAKLRRKQRMRVIPDHQPVQTRSFSYNQEDFRPLDPQFSYNPPTGNKKSYAEVTNHNSINSIETLIKKQLEQTDKLISMMTMMLNILQKQCSR